MLLLRFKKKIKTVSSVISKCYIFINGIDFQELIPHLLRPLLGID